MPSKYRLSRADFQHARGFKRLSGILFNVIYGTISGRENPGGACIISKKVAGTAVVRNRVKRQVRAGLLPYLKGVKSPIIVIFTAKKGAGEAPARALRVEIESLTSKIH